MSMDSIVRSIRSCHAASSRINWISPSMMSQVSLVCAFSAALSIVALTKGRILITSLSTFLHVAEKPLKKKSLVPGLRNLGNNCFLNVILQALASCSCIPAYLGKIMGSDDTLLMVDDESLPLTISLANLLEELSRVCEERIVRSPQKVMLAMTHYTTNFNLTSQQDAAEAFLHLLSSLREEFTSHYTPIGGFTADVTSSNCRIITAKKDYSEQEKWLQHFHGPFDGILGSILTCQSCSSQISLDYQFFHSLSLSPMVDTGATTLAGFTIDDCLNKFIAAEKVENYRCSCCWHVAAAKYLSALGASEADIGKLTRCNLQDSCNCRSISHLEKLPWSNNMSCTMKQLFIARSPKILCIHLQRASINVFGEAVKLQGHIAFPLILDLSEFRRSGLGSKNWEENVQRWLASRQYQKPSGYHMFLNMQKGMSFANSSHELTKEDKPSVVSTAEHIECSISVEADLSRSNMPQVEGGSDSIQFDDKAKEGVHLAAPMEGSIYNLVSVVEHFGRAGGGHYTVYRKVKFEKCCSSRWFCVSDSQVCNVSEEEVLNAEATMLFYERI